MRKSAGIAQFSLSHPGARFSFYRTQAGAEIDLLVEHGNEVVGFEFKCALSVGRLDARGLRAGLESGVITRGVVVYLGSESYPIAPSIEAQPADALLAGN